MTRASPSPRWSMASPLIPKFPRTSSSRSTRLLATTVASNHDLQKRRIPQLSSRKAESGDACIYAAIMRSRSSTTPHLPFYFLPITSIQLFHHQSYGHTFPVPNEPAKSEVHQIPSHPAMICIELPHSYYLFRCARWFPHRVFLCPVCCDIIATTHTDSSSYTVPSFPEVF